jgi:hypothetical protein
VYFSHRAVMRMFLLGMLLLSATTAWAGPAKLLSLRFTVLNSTESELTCQALAGRWYAFELGSEAPGRRFTVLMSLDPATDTVSMFNDIHEAVPIQTLYCGYSGRAWETRFQFPLHRLAGEAAPTGGVTLTCRSRKSALICSRP